MKFEVSGINLSYQNIELVRSSIDFFLQIKSSLGLFDDRYLSVIHSMLDDYRISYRDPNIGLEVFYSDYIFLDRYRKNPSDTIPLKKIKSDFLFNLQSDNYLFVFQKVDNDVEITILKRVNMPGISHRFTIYDKTRLYKRTELWNYFHSQAFNLLFKEKIRHIEEYSECSDLEQLSYTDIELIRMLII